MEGKILKIQKKEGICDKASLGEDGKGEPVLAASPALEEGSPGEAGEPTSTGRPTGQAPGGNNTRGFREVSPMRTFTQ